MVRQVKKQKSHSYLDISDDLNFIIHSPLRANERTYKLKYPIISFPSWS